MKKWLLVIWFLLCGALVKAQHFIEIANLEETWYFNQDDIAFPYVKGNNINPEAIHFHVNFSRYQGKKLIISHEFPYAVFINGQLVYSNSDLKKVIWDVDSLGNSYSKNEVLFSIFSDQKNYDLLQTSVVKASLISSRANEILKNELKTRYERSDFLLIILVLLILFAILINNNSKAFQEFYSLRLILIGRVKDDSIYKLKLFSPGNLSLFLFHSAIISFLILFINSHISFELVNQFLLTKSVFFNWFVFSLIIQITFFLKYFLIKNIGMLFDIGSVSKYYFYEYMRMSMVFFIFVLSLSSVVIISFPYLTPNLVGLIIYATIAFMIIRLIIIFIRIGKQANFKNVHLFSYLCTTEMIPLVFGVKYLIF